MKETIEQTLARYKKMLQSMKNKDGWFYKFILKKGIDLKKRLEVKNEKREKVRCCSH